MKGIAFSVDDKLKILKTLDDLGVAFVEGGWPGANPRDVNFFEEAKKLELKTTKLVAFGSTRKANNKVEEDPILEALLKAETEVICIVAKSHAGQVENVLRTSLENNLAMLSESVEFLKSKGKRVIVDAEHFFDGYKFNSEYSHKFAEATIAGGAETLVFCDTNGGSLPEEVFKITEEFVKKYGSKIKIGMHAHNDCELAVANSIRAVRAGASQVQGTINGYGERCGNANLVSIIPNLELKYKHEEEVKTLPEGNMAKLSNVSKKIAEIANFNHDNYQPFVGSYAFAHKAGLHASAVRRDKSSYEHINPELVGNETEILVSDQAGVSNILNWAKLRDVKLGKNEEASKEKAREILAKLKELEHEGYSFENAGASFEIFVLNFLGENQEYYRFIEHNVHVLNGTKAEATVRVEIAGKETHTAAYGNGPTNALDTAFRNALRDYYPEIDNFQLKDFKVRIIDSHLGTGAKTVVQIATSDGANTWDTLGVSSNIIEAAWDAVADGVEFGLMLQGVKAKGYERSA